MVKLKRSPKNLEIDINVAKKGAIPRFSAARANSAAKRRIPRRGVKIRGVLLALTMTMTMMMASVQSFLHSAVYSLVFYCI